MPRSRNDTEPIASFPRYREISPSPMLAPYVECFWMMTASGAPSLPTASRVLPDGCVDIIINLGPQPPGSPPGAGFADATAGFLAGPMRRPIIAAMDGDFSLCAVRFLPGGAERFFAVPMRELADLTVPLADLWGPDAEDLRERIAGTGSSIAAIRIVERTLEARLDRTERADRIVKGAVALIRRTHGAMAVRELESRIGTSSRQIERRFNDAIGLSPKLFSRIIRFQRSAALLRNDPEIEWQDLVLLSGYFDQAHLIREYREFAGISPGAYRLELAARVASVQSEGIGER